MAGWKHFTVAAVALAGLFLIAAAVGFAMVGE